MAEKFVELVTGELAENEALTSSAGAGDSGKIIGLDANGLLDNSFMPVGVGPDTQSIPASEDLVAGDFVNVWDDATVLKVRKADASNGREAHGFVLSAVTSPANALVYFEGKNIGVTGKSLATEQYLSATAGQSTETPVSTSGYLSQRLGNSTSATVINFEPQRPVTLA